jgi:hypothetical protein
VVFRNKLTFYGEKLLAPRQSSKLEDHPLSAVHDCLFNIFAATLHTWRASPPPATWRCAMPWWLSYDTAPRISSLSLNYWQGNWNMDEKCYIVQDINEPSGSMKAAERLLSLHRYLCAVRHIDRADHGLWNTVCRQFQFVVQYLSTWHEEAAADRGTYWEHRRTGPWSTADTHTQRACSQLKNARPRLTVPLEECGLQGCNAM